MAKGDELRLFDEITHIPRPSTHNERIGEYLMGFAEEHGLPHRIDHMGNVVIRRPGKGRTVTLQAHMDMVPTSEPGYDFDFVNTPLETYVENGWMHARGTTLGADDGSGIAISLCALIDPELEGVDIETLFTVDEEIGLIGALGMEYNTLDGEYLINIDSEDVREITIGCAGSTDLPYTFDFDLVAPTDFCYELVIDGCSGGHSAMEIHKGITNAILFALDIVGRIPGARISSVCGGNAPNAIPMSCRIVFCTENRLNDADTTFIQKECDARRDNDPSIRFSLETAECVSTISSTDTEILINTIEGIPNGPLATDEFGVRTSSNVGVIESEGGVFTVIVKPRSSDIEELNGLVSEITDCFLEVGASTEDVVILPPWRESPDDPLVLKSVEVYRRVFNQEPVVQITHGGLECSVIRERNPRIRGAVSVGPTIHGAHSPEECMDLSTLGAMREYVIELVHSLADSCDPSL